MSTDLDKLISSNYIPTEIERKRAVMMYFLLGLVLVMLSKKKMTLYERFHFKQALGWWMVFFTLLVIFAFLLFVPFVRIIPVFFFFALFIIWIYFVYQAWNGYYVNDNNKIVLPFFYGLGGWIYSIFYLDDEEEKKETK